MASEKKSRPPTLRRVVADTSRQFWSETSVGGLSHAHGARLRPLRLLWLGLFSAGLVLTALDVHAVVTDFLDHPHGTQLDVLHERALAFPAVTVCSQSQLDCVQLTRRALEPRHARRLRAVLRESGCLSERGTACRYLWEVMPGLATAQWISDEQPHCLLCGRCTRYWKHIQGKGNQTRRLDLYHQMGCNSTCLQTHNSEKGADGEHPAQGVPNDAVKVRDTACQPDSSLNLNWSDANKKTEATSGDGDSTRKPGSPDASDSAATSKTVVSDNLELLDDGTNVSEDHSFIDPEHGAAKRPKSAVTQPTRRLKQSQTAKNQARENVTRVSRKRRADDGPGAPGTGPEMPGGPKLPDLKTPSETQDESMLFLAHYMELPETLRAEIGLPFADFVRECSYLGADCTDPRLFRSVNSPQYGNCFTFNTNVTDSADPFAGVRNTSLTGETFSLSFILNLKTYAYPPVKTSSSGARIVIHTPDQVPAVEQAGFNLYPQATTSFAIDQWSIQRLPYPYKAECISDWKQVDFNPYSSINNSTIRESYSVTRCSNMCLQQEFVGVCGCYHPLYPEPTQFLGRDDPRPPAARPCLLTSSSPDLACSERVREQFGRHNTSCHCPSACYEISYNVFQSMTMWPRDTYLATAAGRMKLDVSELTRHDMEKLPENILELKVFYKTMNTQHIAQTPKYTANSLLSSVGGAMSLYLGISLVMVAELLEYFVVLGWSVVGYYTGRYSPSVNPDADVTAVVTAGSSGEPMTPREVGISYSVPLKAFYLPPKTPTST